MVIEQIEDLKAFKCHQLVSKTRHRQEIPPGMSKDGLGMNSQNPVFEEDVALIIKEEKGHPSFFLNGDDQWPHQDEISSYGDISLRKI